MADPVGYEGPATELVRQYKSDLSGFGEQFNKKRVHLTGATVASITLPDAKTGAPWLISLRDETDSGAPANVSCFVSTSLAPSDRARARAVKKSERIDVVAVVAADGYSLGLTNCKVVESGLVMGGAAPPSKRQKANSEVQATPEREPQAAITFVVTNAWNDSVNGVLFVHDAISINGGANDVTLQADDFILSMRLANGARKSYPSMPQAAPTYQKIPTGPFNLGGSSLMVAHEVDPKEDLGAIGTMTIPAHGSARIVVTFQVTDSVADPADNRKVSLH